MTSKKYIGRKKKRTKLSWKQFITIEWKKKNTYIIYPNDILTVHMPGCNGIRLN